MRKSVENLVGRKLTGGRKVSRRGRRKYEIDRYPNEAVAGPNQIVVRRTRGSNIKSAFKTVEFANIIDRETNTVTKSKILSVKKNPANKDYERRGVVSKGANIETEIGTAVVVSRPGQNGVVNAILVKGAATKAS
ncbi:MAG: 30S ribosomal protein S8e [Thermoproteota archaeon]|jgi:small subunit ribosomal protein S8e|nr:30S ribosomal protein S8e [Thermoproteota archaeon]